MNTEIQNTNNNISAADQIPQDVITSLVLNGDLSKMNEVQKVDYYNSFCRHLKLNPLTQPFQIINMKGKLVMYARKDATDQLRKIYGVSVTDVVKEEVSGIYMVTVKGKDKSGREDAAIGAVTINGLQGEALANAIMKAETKAKRRFTLSICGLGILDETEVEDASNVIPEQKNNNVNIDVIDPTNQSNLDKYGPIAQMIFDQRVPEDLFQAVNQTRQQFFDSFAQEFNSGAMPVGKADQILSKLKEYCG